MFLFILIALALLQAPPPSAKYIVQYPSAQPSCSSDPSAVLDLSDFLDRCREEYSSYYSCNSTRKFFDQWAVLAQCQAASASPPSPRGDTVNDQNLATDCASLGALSVYWAAYQTEYCDFSWTEETMAKLIHHNMSATCDEAYTMKMDIAPFRCLPEFNGDGTYYYVTCDDLGNMFYLNYSDSLCSELTNYQMFPPSTCTWSNYYDAYVENTQCPPPGDTQGPFSKFMIQYDDTVCTNDENIDRVTDHTNSWDLCVNDTTSSYLLTCISDTVSRLNGWEEDDCTGIEGHQDTPVHECIQMPGGGDNYWKGHCNYQAIPTVNDGFGHLSINEESNCVDNMFENHFRAYKCIPYDNGAYFSIACDKGGNGYMFQYSDSDCSSLVNKFYLKKDVCTNAPEISADLKIIECPAPDSTQGPFNKFINLYEDNECGTIPIQIQDVSSGFDVCKNGSSGDSYMISCTGDSSRIDGWSGYDCQGIQGHLDTGVTMCQEDRGIYTEGFCSFTKEVDTYISLDLMTSKDSSCGAEDLFLQLHMLPNKCVPTEDGYYVLLCNDVATGGVRYRNYSKAGCSFDDLLSEQLFGAAGSTCYNDGSIMGGHDFKITANPIYENAYCHYDPAGATPPPPSAKYIVQYPSSETTCNTNPSAILDLSDFLDRCREEYNSYYSCNTTRKFFDQWTPTPEGLSACQAGPSVQRGRTINDADIQECVYMGSEAVYWAGWTVEYCDFSWTESNYAKLKHHNMSATCDETYGMKMDIAPFRCLPEFNGDGSYYFVTCDDLGNMFYLNYSDSECYDLTNYQMFPPSTCTWSNYYNAYVENLQCPPPGDTQGPFSKFLIQYDDTVCTNDEKIDRIADFTNAWDICRDDDPTSYRLTCITDTVSRLSGWESERDCTGIVGHQDTPVHECVAMDGGSSNYWKGHCNYQNIPTVEDGFGHLSINGESTSCSENVYENHFRAYKCIPGEHADMYLSITCDKAGNGYVFHYNDSDCENLLNKFYLEKDVCTQAPELQADLKIVECPEPEPHQGPFNKFVNLYEDDACSTTPIQIQDVSNRFDICIGTTDSYMLTCEDSVSRIDGWPTAGCDGDPEGHLDTGVTMCQAEGDTSLYTEGFCDFEKDDNIYISLDVMDSTDQSCDEEAVFLKVHMMPNKCVPTSDGYYILVCNDVETEGVRMYNYSKAGCSEEDILFTQLYGKASSTCYNGGATQFGGNDFMIRDNPIYEDSYCIIDDDDGSSYSIGHMITFSIFGLLSLLITLL